MGNFNMMFNLPHAKLLGVVITFLLLHDKSAHIEQLKGVESHTNLQFSWVRGSGMA
jgi:hypothetical protein